MLYSFYQGNVNLPLNEEHCKISLCYMLGKKKNILYTCACKLSQTLPSHSGHTTSNLFQYHLPRLKILSSYTLFNSATVVTLAV